MLRVFLFMFLFVFANAHNLEIFPEKNGDILRIKAFMHGSDPCANCLVKITKDSTLITTAKTDYKGFVELNIKESEFEIAITDELTHNKQILFPLARNNTISMPIKIASAFFLIALFFGGFYLIKRKK